MDAPRRGAVDVSDAPRAAERYLEAPSEYRTAGQVYCTVHTQMHKFESSIRRLVGGVAKGKPGEPRPSPPAVSWPVPSRPDAAPLVGRPFTGHPRSLFLAATNAEHVKQCPVAAMAHQGRSLTDSMDRLPSMGQLGRGERSSGSRPWGPSGAAKSIVSAIMHRTRRRPGARNQTPAGSAGDSPTRNKVASRAAQAVMKNKIYWLAAADSRWGACPLRGGEPLPSEEPPANDDTRAPENGR
ncbi:hypothetical protein ACCO45_009319 [Purpureocillium lilacinum]|uniref:Uncharacterized protein n=1 Tax=Purpureocillium lilacinum TaxID=33203 RepID=A0ACC4DK71_PURLI